VLTGSTTRRADRDPGDRRGTAESTC